MKFLAFAVAAFSLISAFVAQRTGETLVAVLAGVGLICAITTYRAQTISSFLKIFIAIFAAETIIFGAVYLLGAMGLWPASLEDYMLPESLPLTVAMFAILTYAVAFIPVVKSMTQIADRYFETNDLTVARLWPFPSFGTRERRLAIAAIVFLVILNQVEVGLSVRLSFFRRDWFNAIQAKDETMFWYQIIAVFAPVVFVLIAAQVIEFVVQSTLIMRWRKWLTEYYKDRWLNGPTHYQMSLVAGQSDNPDQRISEDVNRFIDGGQVGYGIYTFSILLISKLSSLVSYAVILWTLSANFTIPRTEIVVPGLMFWIALIYAVIGTFFTHLIGRPLVRLAFDRQKYEADFRFQLARLREYAEQVALLHGETAERISLTKTFGGIITNYYEIVSCRKKLMVFTGTYGQIGPFIPYFIAAPFYFLNKITLGIMTQAAGAFEQVNEALTFFVTYYTTLADYKSVLDRLVSFEGSMSAADTIAASSGLQSQTSPVPGISFTNVALVLPDGRQIVQHADFTLKQGEAAFLTGPSGAGKSTLFRAVSGIWPFGEGTITLPADQRIMLLPQRPYIPIGTLKAAITYPSPPEIFTDAEVCEVLAAAQLAHFTDMIEIEDVWSQRLSGGEQQRLALARAFLAKPDWLFLDEATGAMEEHMEGRIYTALAEKLPNTTVVSIGHRKSLFQFHKRYLEMQPAGTDGVFTCAENPQKEVL
jgi:putative ATP-binding cassette transporter